MATTKQKFLVLVLMIPVIAFFVYQSSSLKMYNTPRAVKLVEKDDNNKAAEDERISSIMLKTLAKMKEELKQEIKDEMKLDAGANRAVTARPPVVSVSDEKKDDPSLDNNVVDDKSVKTMELDNNDNKEVKKEEPKFRFNKVADPTNYPPPKYPNFTIANKDMCQKYPTDYTIYVHSAVHNWGNRKAIRATWGNRNVFLGNITKIVFVLGMNGKESDQQKLLEESERYGDIVQGDFVDSYRNLTYKAMVAIRWFKEYCVNTKFIIKTDDDIFLNIIKVIPMLQPYSNKERLVICPIWQEGTMPILRDPKSCMKWCVKEDEYPGLKGYPRYCSGWTYIYTRDIVEEFYAAIAETPFHWIDDAWVTGAVLNKLVSVTWIDILKYMNGNWPQVYKQYQDLQQPLKTMITHVGYSEMPLLWTAILKRLEDADKPILNTKYLLPSS